ncbi:hypothetical protein ACH5RR_017681 [Cinchona calisaya]|uniref:Uncharacterized protein n=1 Tax=Cinchona calisaya TaxID=153742 RepID=A0ABD2ZM73_9GENT
MAREIFEYDSHLWSEDEIIENRKDLPSDIFFIEIRYRKASMLVQYGAGADVVYDELAGLEVPDYYIMVIIEAAYSFAKAMIADPCNFGREVLPMIIGVAALK